MGIVKANQLVSRALGYVGKLRYVAGGDHAVVLDLNPTEVDCSSFVRLIVALVCGVDLMGYGTSETYWAAALRGKFGPLVTALAPGDIVFRRGDGTYPSPGHIAFVVRVAGGVIYCVSALGEHFGVAVDTIEQAGDQFVGAVRIANLIPDPVTPEDDMQLIEFLAESWNGPATLLYDLPTHTARGVSAIEAPFLKSQNVPVLSPSLAVRQEYSRSGVDKPVLQPMQPGDAPGTERYAFTEGVSFEEFAPEVHAVTEHFSG